MNNFLYASVQRSTCHFTIHFKLVVIIYREVVLCDNVISLSLDVKLVQCACVTYAFRKIRPPRPRTHAHTPAAVNGCVIENVHVRLSLPATLHIDTAKCVLVLHCAANHTFRHIFPDVRML